MHAEWMEVPLEFIQFIAASNQKVLAVGTTSVRTLESLYWLGVKILHSGKYSFDLNLGQWEAYELPQDISLEDSFYALVKRLEFLRLKTMVSRTQLMIVPGYTFRVVQSMITNFHQPGSTLLLLVAAFLGDSWKDTYQYALDKGFRFLSYGDSSLLLG
jgi:S-adenosylmethionine:tRNA ribosyltransferase-isomerase